MLRADIDRNSNIFYNIVDARVDTGDQNFVLEAQSMREITVFLTATDENLRNLNNNSEIFKLPLNVDGDIDKVSMSANIEMFKIDPVETGTDAGEYAGLAGNIIFLLGGLIILVAVLVTAFRIIRSASSPLEEISTFDDYEYTQGNTFNPPGLPTAPELPSEDKVANSMYGGSEEIFKQPPPPLNPQENLVEEIELDEENITPGVPEIPESGLPDGWTMEQWKHYGQAWIDQQNES